MFKTFMQTLGSRYAGQRPTKIWNEENLSREMGWATSTLSHYLPLLMAGAIGPKAGDPNTLGLLGGAEPNRRQHSG